MVCRYELKCEAYLVTEQGAIKGACTVSTMVDHLARMVQEPSAFDEAVENIILSDTDGNCVQSDVFSKAGQDCSFIYRV